MCGLCGQGCSARNTGYAWPFTCQACSDSKPLTVSPSGTASAGLQMHLPWLQCLLAQWCCLPGKTALTTQGLRCTEWEAAQQRTGQRAQGKVFSVNRLRCSGCNYARYFRVNGVCKPLLSPHAKKWQQEPCQLHVMLP